MKKMFIFTWMLLSLFGAQTASAQDYNLFAAEDVDENGWLWFNTQEKIDKYVGLCDEDNYTVDPNGKIVQLAFANITPDYPATVADPEAYGTDTQGYLATDEGVNTEELVKGSIILAPAAAQMSMNGGCLILKLPSCSTISLYLSSEARMLGRTLMLTPGYDLSTDDSTGENPWTGHTKSIFAKASVFGSIHAAGHYKWETVATDNNGYNTGITFQSDEPVYFALQNCNKYPIFIHGIKVTTPKQESTEGGDDNKPAITATGTNGVERTISLGLNGAGKVSVDWGDGNLVEQTTTQAYDGVAGSYASFTGTPTGTIKIYGDGIIYLEANGKFNADKTDIPNALTTIDVTNAPDLTDLALNANKLNQIDLSKNTQLAKLNIANNQIAKIDLSVVSELTNFTANDNQITELDLSKNAKLTTVVLSNNKLKTLDFTNNPLVKTITCLNNELTSVTFGENTASKHTIQFGGNKLTTINLSGFTDFSGTYLRLRDNELTEIVLPGKINQIWADGNHFTLAQLYALQMLSQIKNFTYATIYTKEYAQAPYEIPEKIDVNGTVDLSSQATLGTTATNFTWKTADGTTLVEGTDYTVSNGVFTFLTGKEAIHCEMTNAELSAFTAAKPYITTTMKVEGTTSIQSVTDGESNGNSVWYNLNGQRVAQPTQKGLYIRSGKKLIVK